MYFVRLCTAMIVCALFLVPAHADRLSVKMKMVDVPAGTFEMGRPVKEKGAPDELPRHKVSLSAYAIGVYEVTNGQYAAVLNWALKNGHLKHGSGGDVTLHFTTIKKIDSRTDIVFQDGAFRAAVREDHLLNDHPVNEVSWYGAVAFCNWLSLMKGLEPCYDLRTWEPIAPWPGGYRLPTEAEWERAAGWDLSGKPRRWTYAFMGDTVSADRLNYDFNKPLSVLGLVNTPYTAPVGYFNGKNEGTVDSPSPVGCYDMAGSVYEWCQDWFDYYPEEKQQDPMGPPEGLDVVQRGPNRVLRGGSWGSNADTCRISNRGFTLPQFVYTAFGFRVARSR